MKLKSEYSDYSPDVFSDVEEFFLLAQPEMVGKPFGNWKPGVLSLGKKLIEEEVIKELMGNLDKLIKNGYSIERAADLMDDCVDSIYVILWLMKGLDLPFNEHWQKVQEANMAKFPIHEACGGRGCNEQGVELAFEYEGKKIDIRRVCMNGRIVSRNVATGKVTKPEGWTPVNNFGVLFNYWKKKVEKEQEILEKNPKSGMKGDSE